MCGDCFFFPPQNCRFYLKIIAFWEMCGDCFFFPTKQSILFENHSFLRDVWGLFFPHKTVDIYIYIFFIYFYDFWWNKTDADRNSESNAGGITPRSLIWGPIMKKTLSSIILNDSGSCLVIGLFKEVRISIRTSQPFAPLCVMHK